MPPQVRSSPQPRIEQRDRDVGIDRETIQQPHKKRENWRIKRSINQPRR